MHVINLSQQTDSSDLLGGFKPVDVRSHIVLPLKERFEEAFAATFSVRENVKFFEACRKAWCGQQWKRLAALWRKGLEMVQKKYVANDGNSLAHATAKLWSQVETDLGRLERHLVALASGKDHGLFFSFIEGTLVQAIKRGDWVLLDEINLAAPETLECLSSLLQSKRQSIVLADRGDDEEIPRHPSFRIFACMNPSTDVGKRDLPAGIRSRFTELWVGGMDEAVTYCQETEDWQLVLDPGSQGYRDLILVASRYLGPSMDLGAALAHHIIEFYMGMKHMANRRELASEGTTERPHFSMRTLVRSLMFSRRLLPFFGLRRAIYEGCSMAFCTVLDTSSEQSACALLQRWIVFGGNPDASATKIKPRELAQFLQRKGQAPSHLSAVEVEKQFVQMFGFFVTRGTHVATDEQQALIDRYILTPSISKNLCNLTRSLLAGYPILLQGPTSAGKTSMIEYVAAITGHRFVRINNHEHTDLQEYVGTYVWDETERRLVFREGVLVQALRNGMSLTQ